MQPQTFYQELLASDWLGRNPDSYTFIKDGISMGWEETLTRGKALSSFFIKASNNPPMDKQLFLTKQACSKIFSRLNFTKQPANIIFSKDFKSYQLGKTICVTVEPLKSTDTEFPTYNHRLDPILGYCVHEIAHFLYTPQEYTDYILSLSGLEQRVKKDIMNILEDERIEQKINVSYRGYTDYIGKAKDYAFDKKWNEDSRTQLANSKEIDQLFTSFLYLVRYPKALSENIVGKFENELKQIKSILTPYPTTIPELIICTDKIYDVLDQYLEDEYESQTQDQHQNQQQDNNQQGGQGQKKKGKGTPQQGGQPQDGGDDGEEQEDGSGQPGGDQDGDAQDSQDGDGNGQGGTQAPGDGGQGQQGSGNGKPQSGGNQQQGQGRMTVGEALQEILEVYEAVVATAEELDMDEADIAKMLGRSVAPPVIKEINQFDNKETDNRTSYVFGYPETANLHPTELNVRFIDANKLNAKHNNYEKALAEVRTYASNLRAKFQQLNRNHEVVLRGLAEGDFDDTMLVDSFVGTKNVYMEQHRIRNRSAVIGLLIDESGSMDGLHIKHARQIAVLFERALTGVNNIDFYCYGHTTSSFYASGGGYDTTHINVYFEGLKKSNRFNLGKIHSHNTNRDGHAILEVVGRMRQTVSMDKPIILFMVSDGAPSASVPHGYDGKTYTKKSVNTVEKHMNTQIIHIAIEDGIDSKSMFNNYLKFTNPNTLVHDIGNVLKKVMLKQQQAEII